MLSGVTNWTGGQIHGTGAVTIGSGGTLSANTTRDYIGVNLTNNGEVCGSFVAKPV